MVKVFPEPPLLDSQFHILVCRGNDPDIRNPFPAATDRGIYILLQYPKKHGLDFMRHGAYLVKEQRAAFRQVEISALCRIRTGERAFLVPEKQRGGQLTGQCATVYGDKRLAISFAVVMDGLCHRFLTGPVGSEYHHGHLGRGDQSGKLFHFQDHGACAVKQLPLLLSHGGYGMEYIFRQFQQVIPVYRFRQVVPGSQFDGAHNVRDGNVFGRYDERDVLLLLAQPFQQGNAVAFRQPHVRQYKVELRFAYQRAGYRLVHGCHRFITGLGKPVFLYL